jgi:hypothetical protein
MMRELNSVEVQAVSGGLVDKVIDGSIETLVNLFRFGLDTVSTVANVVSTVTGTVNNVLKSIAGFFGVKPR